MRKVVTSEDWKNLNTNDINAGVRKFISHLNMSGGSIGDMDLYVLLRHYLRNDEVRKQINQVLNDNRCL